MHRIIDETMDSVIYCALRFLQAKATRFQLQESITAITAGIRLRWLRGACGRVSAWPSLISQATHRSGFPRDSKLQTLETPHCSIYLVLRASWSNILSKHLSSIREIQIHVIPTASPMTYNILTGLQATTELLDPLKASKIVWKSNRDRVRVLMTPWNEKG